MNFETFEQFSRDAAGGQLRESRSLIGSRIVGPGDGIFSRLAPNDACIVIAPHSKYPAF